jgi:tight adherence protein B
VQEYDVYIIPLKWKVIYCFLAAVIISSVSYLFYRNLILAVILSPLSLFYLKYKKKQLILRRKNELNLQFKDLLASLASSLSAGKAIENAFVSALDDLHVLFPGEEASIIKETGIIIHKLSLNVTVEEAISDLAKRSKLDDIINFSDVICICKRTGGNLIEAIKNASGIISDKIEMKQEIETLLSSRRFEQKILNIIPVAMILILSVTAEEYMSPVFTTIQGKAAMSVCLLLLILACILSNKIMNIKM